MFSPFTWSRGRANTTRAFVVSWSAVLVILLLVLLPSGVSAQTIANELVEAVRRNVTIDWTVRENARAQIRVMVKRILRKYDYPPDMQAKATELVLEQATVLCTEWA